MPSLGVINTPTVRASPTRGAALHPIGSGLGEIIDFVTGSSISNVPPVRHREISHRRR